jgi:hypothetical protein
MNTCARYQRLLHLHRDGERSPRQQAWLDRHLARCPRCRADATRLAWDDKGLNVERRQPAVPADPDALTKAILARLLDATARSTPHHNPSSGRLSSWLETRSVRLACALSVVCIVTAFVIESVDFFQDITTLESELIQRDDRGMETAFVVPREELGAMAPGVRFTALPSLYAIDVRADELCVPLSAITDLDDIPRSQLAQRCAVLLGEQWSIDDILRRASRLTRVEAVLQFNSHGA